MSHVITKPNGRDLGFGCSCGDRLVTQKLADKHAEDQNLIEGNAAKAEAAKIAEAAERVAPAAEGANPEQPDHLAAGFVLQHSIHPCPQGDPRTTGPLPVSRQQQDQSPARRVIVINSPACAMAAASGAR